MAPEICPNCGAEVPPNARACPECGSDEETGWSEEAAHGSLGLPDDNFNYSDFVNKEFGEADPVPRGIPKFWWFAGLLLLGFIIFMFLRSR